MMGQIPAMYNMQWRMPNYASFNMSSLRLAMWGGAAVSRPFVESLSQWQLPFFKVLE